MRTAKPCGPDPPTLGSSLSMMIDKRRWLQSPVHRGERGISRKTMAQGVPDCLGVPVVSNSCAFYLAHEAAGAHSIRHSLRPLDFEGRELAKARAKPAAGMSCHALARAVRSTTLTIFWHCGFRAFSSRTTARRPSWQPTVNGFDRGFRRLEGSGNADSQPKVWSSPWSGRGRPCDSGRECAHPPSWRASAAYRPLRAVWAGCAWALRGCGNTHETLSRADMAHRPKRNP